MDITQATAGFAAMGSEPRFAVVQVLVKAGTDGLPTGAIGERTGIPASTLAHHIKFLAAADLITQERQGRMIVCRANFEHLKALAAYIMKECCAEQNAESEAAA
ncbi:MAG: ArsR/SmtB family transcription factor [Devosiaceae bacterium]